MSVASVRRIDASASVDPSAHIDPSAVIGPGCIVEALAFVGPRCVIGAGTRLRPRAMIVQDTELGERNDVHPYAVLGGDPQDRAFRPEVPGRLVIGHDNIFRESVTISRGTGAEIPTRIGSHCYFMAAAHAGHNVQVGSHVTFANGVLIAGHARIGDRVTLAGCAMVHQFCHVGPLAMFQGGGACSMHCPPYAVIRDVNVIAGINVIGLRRAGVTLDQREQIKRVFKAICRDRTGRPLVDRIAEARAWTLEKPALDFLEFVDDAMAQTPPRARGLCVFPPPRFRSEPAAE